MSRVFVCGDFTGELKSSASSSTNSSSLELLGLSIECLPPPSVAPRDDDDMLLRGFPGAESGGPILVGGLIFGGARALFLLLLLFCKRMKNDGCNI